MKRQHKHNPVPSGKNPDGDLTLIQIMQRFSSEEAAREYFEALRWPDGPVCPHCSNDEAKRIYKVTANPENLRGFAYPPQQVADRLLHDVRQQDAGERASVTAPA
jgi:hypothetical protein